MSRNVKSILSASLLALTIAVPLTPAPAIASETGIEATQAVNFRAEKIGEVNIAYREAGDPSRPTVLLLHGFPTSSHMFRNLIPELAKNYHVIAPDFPGFGASDMPQAEDFDYSFANIAEIMTSLLDRKGVDQYAVYLMDYGAPVGFRMFAEQPERVTGFVIQNGNAYEEGLREFWDPIKAYWADPSKENGDQLRGFLTLDATKWQFTHGVQRLELISPDNYWHVQYLLDREGNQEVQLELFLDYGTNVAEYPKWQALFREHQPPALLMWGKNDHIFPAEGALPYQRDLKDLEFHLLDTGHFALEEYGSEIAEQMTAFLNRITAAGN
ncbi:alpha/beta hydrolase [Ruegeria sp. HKCCSP346]|uniref:alpha/beta fold hydrolase n=1 Tax=Ruegeria sp. HKCCSP346 TaxID=2794830 RepID=UPI001AE7369C|nr:alpha/beta hydrolase [Ruegeria sp. HKCCSP346]